MDEEGGKRSFLFSVETWSFSSTKWFLHSNFSSMKWLSPPNKQKKRVSFIPFKGIKLARKLLQPTLAGPAELLLVLMLYSSTVVDVSESYSSHTYRTGLAPLILDTINSLIGCLAPTCQHNTSVSVHLPSRRGHVSAPCVCSMCLLLVSAPCVCSLCLLLVSAPCVCCVYSTAWLCLVDFTAARLGSECIMLHVI
jgi:hypothetical protein